MNAVKKNVVRRLEELRSTETNRIQHNKAMIVKLQAEIEKSEETIFSLNESILLFKKQKEE